MPESKKRNEIEENLGESRTGTGTQIVHSERPYGPDLAVRVLVENEDLEVGGWDSRVRVQDFLTEDTGRGHSLGSEIEGWFATVERPSSVGPRVSVCGPEAKRVVHGARMGKLVPGVKRTTSVSFMNH